MIRHPILLPVFIFSLGATFLMLTAGVATSGLNEDPGAVVTATPTFDISRLQQPATPAVPLQADNGAQVYWGMCMSCHGDRGQGLTAEWRDSFGMEARDCWASGCHGEDAPQNSFQIPAKGAPTVAGAGSLARFSNAYELKTYITETMPLFPPGSLTQEQAWDLTAYLMQMNEVQPAGLTLGQTNGAAIPVHGRVSLPENEAPGVLLLTGILILAAIGLGSRLRGERDEEKGARSRPNFFHHLHPARIPAAQSRFLYTLGAGGLAVFFSLVLLATGLLEMYYYVPTPGQAASSVQSLTGLIPYGNLVRNLHFWSAQFLVIVMTVHLLRVVLTGAYAPPRRGNYLIGLGLFILILLLDFTGYVLRWDEGVRWALVVGTNLLKSTPWMGAGLYQFVIGAAEPGAATLIRFFTWHVFGLTLAVVILVIWHIFRVRRDGGIAVAPQKQSGKVWISRFDLVRKEVLVMLIAGMFLLLFALIFPAPIAAPISESAGIQGDSGAPWFFLWIQVLLKSGDPFVMGVLIPVLVMVVLGLIPYILPSPKKEEQGAWFSKSNRLAQVLILVLLFLILTLTVMGAVLR
jgi:quinol-cytochrome oxidoreductase complex cytochrome b subunit/mono/diheme cytochrome c family protein